MQETQDTRVRSLGWGDPLEEEIATHSSILAWRIPSTEEAGGLQPVGSQRVRHDCVTEHAEPTVFSLSVAQNVRFLFQWCPSISHNTLKVSK